MLQITDPTLGPVAADINGLKQTSQSLTRQISDFDMVEYFHLEFDSHDVIDAEGALCESFRDDTTRSCAPLALNGGRSRLWSHLRNAAAPIVDRRRPFDLIRDRLESRAGV